MFVNLYLGLDGSEFRDYNFSYFLAQLYPVSESHIVAQFDEKLRGGQHWDENELAAIFELTLSERVCESFFRDIKGIPATQRDFYLSKLFQFLALSMEAALGDVVVDKLDLHLTLEDLLEEIADAQLKQLHQFDWWRFQADIAPRDGHTLSVEEMKALLIGRWKTYLHGAEEGAESEPSDSESTLSARRQRLLDSYKTIVGGTAASIYKASEVGVDKSDFYSWRRGELPDSSKMAHRIEAFIQNAVREGRQRPIR